MGVTYCNERVTCYKCGRNVSGLTADGWLLTKQFGCKHCNKSNWPKYRPDYNSGYNVWVIFKEYWKPLKSWWGLGPMKDYLIEETIRLADDPAAPELAFESLEVARAYIRKLTGKEDPEKPKKEAREAALAFARGVIDKHELLRGIQHKQ